jgi:uncharacterized protein YecE (DUF72 family)
VRRPLRDFLKTCSVLEDKLGPCLIGLSATFRKDLERFDEFLSILPEYRFPLSFATTRGLATRFFNGFATAES